MKKNQTPEDYQFEQGKEMDREWRKQQRVKRAIIRVDMMFQRIWRRIYHKDKSPWK